MLRKVAICAVMAAAVLAAGCGGSDDSASEADTEAIGILVDRINEASESKDAAAFCAIMRPSAVESTFHGMDRCVEETKPILEAAGKPPTLEIDDVAVDGDVARVTFSNSGGREATFVRENGRWYVPFSMDDAAGGQSAGSGEGEG